MKILLISNVYPPGFVGGYELGASEIASYLSEKGHEILVVTSDYFAEEGADLPYAVERSLECPSLAHQLRGQPRAPSDGPLINWRNIRRIGGAVRRFRPDMVLAFNLAGLGALGIVQFLNACKLPTILYIMDNVFGGLDRNSREFAAFRQVFGEPTFAENFSITAMSRNVTREMNASIDCSRVPTTYVPGWFDDGLFNGKGEPEMAPDGEVRFVFSSRVAPHKGTEILVEATRMLATRPEAKFSIDVYGSGLVAPFLHLVRKHGLDSYIRYRGLVPKAEMSARYANYDALLFPTWEREPFGFVVSEAAGASCIPVMTGAIGASEWFLDKVDCIKISRNAASLAGAMLDLMSMGPEKLKRFRMAARRAAVRNLARSRWLPRIETACLDLVKRSEEPNWEASRSIQSAFLLLDEFFHERLAA